MTHGGLDTTVDIPLNKFYRRKSQNVRMESKTEINW